jgi:hypothetical protein
MLFRNSFIKPKVEYLPADLAKMSERLSTISSAVGQPSNPTKRFTQPLDFLVEELGLQLDSILPNEKMGPELTFVLNVKLFNQTNLLNIIVVLGAWKTKQR